MRLNIERFGYKVGSHGTILGKTGRPLRQHSNGVGYLVVPLLIEGRRYNELVHRLVAYKWCEKFEGRNYVNHKDGNKWNNKATNLEWCTNQENGLHYRKGYIPNIQETIATAIELYIQGYSYKDIDVQLGLYKGAARRYINGIR